jgi:hypothetical protein
MRPLNAVATLVATFSIGALAPVPGASAQTSRFLGLFASEQRVARGLETVPFVIRENGQAVVRTSYEGDRNTAVESARWTGGAGGGFCVTTQSGSLYDVDYVRADTIRVAPIDSSGRVLYYTPSPVAVITAGAGRTADSS